MLSAPKLDRGEFVRTLPSIIPTAEQLPLIGDNRTGVEVIRGAAGSGKTSTAILRLRSLAYMFEERWEREQHDSNVQLLVLTFNRTLAGYVRALVDEQVRHLPRTNVTIDTFGRWARNHLGNITVVGDQQREAKLGQLGHALPLSSNYVAKEVDYLLGRFHPDDLEEYISAERTGRGVEPRVDRALRRLLLDDVVHPYRLWLRNQGLVDWNDVAVMMSDVPRRGGYDIAIIDESQDFSANQLRAVHHHLADDPAVTFVIDTIQRIYARGFTWSDVGFDMTRARRHILQANHRNTKQIAAFAAGILEGVVAEDDGALPNLDAATTSGEKPKVIVGKYNLQLDWAINYIEENVDLTNETVAFLKPRGGNFFSEITSRLAEDGIDYVDITRQPEWPDGPENVAISTFHSAKGLEFDHVIILGLNAENTPHASAGRDDEGAVLRRLLAVAVARARKSVVIGYKESQKSALVDHFKSGTFDRIKL